MTSEMKSSGENARETQQAHSGSQCTVGTGELQGEHQELDFRYLDIKIFQQHTFIEQIALHLTQAGYFSGHSGYNSKQTQDSLHSWSLLQMLFGRMYWVSSHMKALIVTKRILIQNSFCSFQSFSEAKVLGVEG